MKLINNFSTNFKAVRASDVFIDGWFEKAKEMQKEFCFEPTALDRMATQQRPSLYQQDDLSAEDKDEFKTTFVYPIVDVALSKL